MSRHVPPRPAPPGLLFRVCCRVTPRCLPAFLSPAGVVCRQLKSTSDVMTREVVLQLLALAAVMLLPPLVVKMRARRERLARALVDSAEPAAEGQAQRLRQRTAREQRPLSSSRSVAARARATPTTAAGGQADGSELRRGAAPAPAPAAAPAASPSHGHRLTPRSSRSRRASALDDA